MVKYQGNRRKLFRDSLILAPSDEVFDLPMRLQVWKWKRGPLPIRKAFLSTKKEQNVPGISNRNYWLNGKRPWAVIERSSVVTQQCIARNCGIHHLLYNPKSGFFLVNWNPATSLPIQPVGVFNYRHDLQTLFAVIFHRLFSCCFLFFSKKFWDIGL